MINNNIATSVIRTLCPIFIMYKCCICITAIIQDMNRFCRFLTNITGVVSITAADQIFYSATIGIQGKAVRSINPRSTILQEQGKISIYTIFRANIIGEIINRHTFPRRILRRQRHINPRHFFRFIRMYSASQ